jgi:hypothetical protein
VTDICSNCGEPIKVIATMKKDAGGNWRHAELCGEELRGLKVTRSLQPIRRRDDLNQKP